MAEQLDHFNRNRLVRWTAGGCMVPVLWLLLIVGFTYQGVVFLRNAMFDMGLRRTRQLGRPVISVGNITMGGTGKTPVIRWLADHLREDGRHVCVLSRGYKARPGELGDELTMLDKLLNAPGKQPIEMRANPKRHSAGQTALMEDPSIDVFLLDDGFQHRMLHRDLDIVLISAVAPFGIAPGIGMLREPLRGLGRADVIVLTHVDQVNADQLLRIERTIRVQNAAAPIVHARHALRGFRSAHADSGDAPDIALGDLSGRKWMPVCGIANPNAFVLPLTLLAGDPVGQQSFNDHHDYSEEDLVQIRARAADQGAAVLVTTEKDWVKLARFPAAFDEKLPIWRTEMQIEFQGDGEAKLLEVVRACLRSARPAG